MFLKSDADGFVSRPPNTVYMKRVIYVVYNLRMTHQNVTNPTQTAGSATKMSWVPVYHHGVVITIAYQHGMGSACFVVISNYTHPQNLTRTYLIVRLQVQYLLRHNIAKLEACNR